MIVPTEQALSMPLCTADTLRRIARVELRVLTGLLKLRACRENVPVAIPPVPAAKWVLGEKAASSDEVSGLLVS